MRSHVFEMADFQTAGDLICYIATGCGAGGAKIAD
jgi:hypothetical protein